MVLLVFSLVAVDCVYQLQPDQHIAKGRAASDAITANLAMFRGARKAPPGARPTARGFVDEILFRKQDEAGVAAAGLTTDGEFVRRVYLDLTGRLPEAAQVREFLADGSAGKRTALIDKLVASSEFTDRWSVWMGDWLMNSLSGVYSPVTASRNQFHNWMRAAVKENRSLRQIAFDVMTADTNSGRTQTGVFLGAAEVNNGPKEDGWDNMMVKSASQFLGLGHYDCLVCHNGSRRLDTLSLWGSKVTRIEAQRMAALFTNSFSYPGLNSAVGMQYFQTNGYWLETAYGNRPKRTPAPEGVFLSGQYRDGTKPEGPISTWRTFFASKVVEDPMFARNMANRLWKQMFGIGLVEPVDGLDPARLDPANPPPSPWTLQASQPELLERLAERLRDTDYDLRDFVRFVANSATYQLSSAFEGEWKSTYVPLFARHYPRRLEAEEIHDAIVLTTGVPAYYEITGINGPVRYAMHFPDTAEPIRDRPVREFLNLFYRGNRVGAARNPSSSLLQSVQLMNHPFVLSRLDAAKSPLLKSLAAKDSVEEAVTEAFLTFLSRYPSDAEMKTAAAALREGESRERAVEDLAWALINKVEFIFTN